MRQTLLAASKTLRAAHVCEDGGGGGGVEEGGGGGGVEEGGGGGGGRGEEEGGGGGGGRGEEEGGGGGGGRGEEEGGAGDAAGNVDEFVLTKRMSMVVRPLKPGLHWHTFTVFTATALAGQSTHLALVKFHPLTVHELLQTHPRRLGQMPPVIPPLKAAGQALHT